MAAIVEPGDSDASVPIVGGAMPMHMVGWGVACLGGSVAAAGMSMHLHEVAYAGSGIWILAAALHGAAILQRFRPLQR
jgi:hypothetical protein